MINRIAIAHDRGWTVAEIYRAKDAWRKLYTRQPDSMLSFTEYLDMIECAGLRPSMIGLRRGQYHLARYNDSGSYTKHNCRFVPQEVNQAERKEGYQKKPSYRKLMSEIAQKRVRSECAHCAGMFTPSMLARWHGTNCKMRKEAA